LKELKQLYSMGRNKKNTYRKVFSLPENAYTVSAYAKELGCYLAKRFCPHKNKIHIMYNYYERCEVEQCIECKEKIYTEI
jgi:hypothetical protein